MTTKRGPFLLPRAAGEERQPHFRRADAWLRTLMILARLLAAIMLLTPLHAAENGAAPSSLNVPEGAEELGRFGAWAVFEYPRDPSRRCHVGTLAPPGGDTGRLLVDADAEFLTLIPLRGDGLGSSSIGVGSRIFTLGGWEEGDPADTTYLKAADDMILVRGRIIGAGKYALAGIGEESGFVEAMTATESAGGAARLLDGWSPDSETLQIFPLDGFTAAFEAARAGLCRGLPVATSGPAEVVVRAVEAIEPGAPVYPVMGSAQWRITGAFFKAGEPEELLLRAVQKGSDPVGGGHMPAYHLVDARLEYYRNGRLVGWDEFGWYTGLKQICALPESGRLALVFVSSSGGSAGGAWSYSVHYDPSSGEMVSAPHGVHKEFFASDTYFGNWIDRVSEVLEDAEQGVVDAPPCEFRVRGSAVESFAKRLVKDELFRDYLDWAGEGGVEPEALLRAAINRYHLDMAQNDRLFQDRCCFRDTDFSALLRQIREGGPDYPLRYERFDGGRFSVVNVVHRIGRGELSPLNQTVFMRAADEDYWGMIHHAGPDSIWDHELPADVEGLVDGRGLRMGLCVEDCYSQWEATYGWMEVDLEYVPTK